MGRNNLSNHTGIQFKNMTYDSQPEYNLYSFVQKHKSQVHCVFRKNRGENVVWMVVLSCSLDVLECRAATELLLNCC